MGCLILLRFLALANFVVSTYVIIIWVCWILMAYASSTTNLLTRLQKKSSSSVPKENDHMQVYTIKMKDK